MFDARGHTPAPHMQCWRRIALAGFIPRGKGPPGSRRNIEMGAKGGTCLTHSRLRPLRAVNFHWQNFFRQQSPSWVCWGRDSETVHHIITPQMQNSHLVTLRCDMVTVTTHFAWRPSRPTCLLTRRCQKRHVQPDRPPLAASAQVTQM